VKWKTYQIQTLSGIVKKNEVREKEGMKPLPELDQEPQPLPAACPRSKPAATTVREETEGQEKFSPGRPADCKAQFCRPG
jgi:hypothetical protein